MSIDLNAIKNKIQQLNGSLRKSKVNFWRPKEEGEYRIRVIPWKNNEGQPFKEKWFYYNIGENFGILAPTQFQKPDPVQELINKLHSTNKKEDKDVAKLLYPKMRAYAAVTIRGQEDQGVYVWAFGKEIYERLLGFFMDEDTGDYTDPEEGFDLKVKLTKSAKKKFLDTTVDVAKKQSKLHTDSEKALELINNVPDLDDYFKLQTYDEIKGKLDAWVNGKDAVSESTDSSQGTAHASSTAEPDELDKLVNEVKTEVVVAAESKTKRKKTEEVATAPVPSKMADLDSVFDEIMNDD